MENTDLLPHPLEPELDHDISLLSNNYTKNSIPMERAAVAAWESSNYLDGSETDVTMLRLLSEAGIQSSLQMAKLLQDNHQSHVGSGSYSGSSSSSRQQQKLRRQQQKLRQQQLQAEFTIDMTQIPPRSSKKPLRRRKKVGGSVSRSNNGSAKIASTGRMNTAAVSSDDKVQREEQGKQQNTTDAAATLEDSLVAMAQRLSPGNNDTHHDDHQYDQAQQQLQQHVRHNSTLTSTTISSIDEIKSSTTKSNDDQLYNWSEKKDDSNLHLSTLPNPNLIHQMGPIQSRTTLRSLLMKKWHTDCWWMHYDRYSILIFRSKDHLDDWVQNPYHGKKEREYLIKLHIDFGDIGGVGGGKSGSGSVNEGVASGNNSNKDDNGGEDGGQTTNILGHRILPIKQKNYGKKSNHNDLYEFKLERWTNMGVSVLAAFASEEMEDVQLLYDTIVEIMERCPYGGLHNIDHMLKK
jgi:hypothetical protein